MVLGFAACGGDDDGGGASAALGTGPLILEGQIYKVEDNPNATSASDVIKTTAYTGNLAETTIASSLGKIGGSVKITNGALSYTVAAAAEITDNLESMDSLPSELAEMGYSETKISDTTAKSADLEPPVIEGKDVSRSKTTVSGTDTNYSVVSEEISYMYVDKAVSITAKGSSVTEKGVTMTIKDLNISLAAGWNTIYTKSVMTGNGSRESATIEMSVSNPDLNWTFGDTSY